jgi:OmcA/MtrC family decaheme c-type cytochrome
MDVTIDEAGVPTITFTLNNAEGGILSLGDVDRVRFVAARLILDEDTLLTHYENYFVNEVEGAAYQFNGETVQPALETATQPTFASEEGTFEEVEPGVYRYTFAEPLGEAYDPDETQVFGAEITRDPRTVAANPVYSFVPDGDEPRSRLIADTASCNNCHAPLALHGGGRQEVGLCVLCHTPQNVDPESGNSLDFKEMVHRIHSGANLPTVQEGGIYAIVGFRQSVHDYSHVVWPQDTRNCLTCHTGPDGENYKTKPNIAACTGCHDNVDPSTSTNHRGNPKTDEDCVNCHFEDMVEFDEESIPGAHLLPWQSEDVQGVNLEIVSIDNVSPSESPTITFKIADNEGNVIAPIDMSYLAVTVAGPTTDYTMRVTETIYREPSEDAEDNGEPPEPLVEDVGDGAFSYTFVDFAIPEETTGTYAFGLEGYVNEDISGVRDPVRIAGFNPVTYMNVDGGQPVARRQVIDLAQCNNCHNRLALHGTIRQNTEYCVLCHNPNATDEARRPEEAMPPTSINFRMLIHRIHSGAESEEPVLVYGFGGSLHDYSHTEFPGNLNDCETCHLEGTYELPLATGIQPTTITQDGDIVSVTGAINSVCTACHSTQAAEGHAILQTTTDGIETCAVCHGSNRDFAVDESHQ